jgi:hypothetical protein
MAPIDDAITAFKAQDPDEQLSIRAFAKNGVFLHLR